MRLGLGLGLTHRRTVSGGGGGAYTTQAVHFDANTFLSIDSLTATDSRYYAFFFWARWSRDERNGNGVLFVHDPDNTYAPYANFIESTGGLPADGQFAMEFYPPVGSSDLSIYDDPSSLPPGAWHSVVGAVDTGAGAGLKIADLIVDRVRVGDVSADEGEAFVNVVNGVKFIFGADGPGDVQVGDYFDVRIAPAQNWLTDGLISEATLNLFVTEDNTPINPSVATATLGAPAVLFSGDAASFADNQGSGGSFTTTGELTDAMPLLEAFWRNDVGSGNERYLVFENMPVDTVLADLTASGAYPGSPAFETFTKILDPDNKFSIVGTTLVLSDTLDFEIATSHSVTIRATDTEDNSFDRELTITVVDT